jgi:hypothetical protein
VNYFLVDQDVDREKLPFSFDSSEEQRVYKDGTVKYLATKYSTHVPLMNNHSDFGAKFNKLAFNFIYDKFLEVESLSRKIKPLENVIEKSKLLIKSYINDITDIKLDDGLIKFEYQTNENNKDKSPIREISLSLLTGRVIGITSNQLSPGKFLRSNSRL